MPKSDAADKLIQAHDGDMALLYIWMKQRSSTDLKQAARDLCMTKSRVEDAAEKLKIYELFPSSAGKKPAPAPVELEPSDDPVAYTSRDLENASKDKSFKAILDYAEQMFGKLLTKDDMVRLLNIYKNSGLSAEVIYVLLNFCHRVSDRRPTMTFIQKKANEWRDRGLFSVEQAEKFADDATAMKSREGEILKIVNIHERVPANITELIDSWIAARYTDEQIEKAYGITYEKTGKLAWRYMDTVLQGMSAGDAPVKEAKSELPKSIRK